MHSPVDGPPVAVTDILRNVNFNTEIIGDIRNLRKYNVVDGDTPEIVSDKLYGTPDHYWVLLLVNQMSNPFYEWPLDNRSMDKYLAEKYGESVVFLCDKDDASKPCLANIRLGDTVFKTADALDAWGNPTNSEPDRGLVVSWDKTIGRLGVRKKAGSALFIYDDDILGFVGFDDTLTYAKVKVAVDSPYEAAHHFEVSGASVDPWNDLDGYFIGSTGDSGATVQYWNTHIGLYLGASGSAFTEYAVSIREFETESNETRRSIFIVEPSRIPSIVEQFRTLISR